MYGGLLPPCGAPSSGRHASQYRTELFDEGDQGNVSSGIPAIGNWPRQIASPLLNPAAERSTGCAGFGLVEAGELIQRIERGAAS
jgi:hypothetical protein